MTEQGERQRLVKVARKQANIEHARCEEIEGSAARKGLSPDSDKSYNYHRRMAKDFDAIASLLDREADAAPTEPPEEPLGPSVSSRELAAWARSMMGGDTSNMRDM